MYTLLQIMFFSVFVLLHLLVYERINKTNNHSICFARKNILEYNYALDSGRFLYLGVMTGQL